MRSVSLFPLLLALSAVSAEADSGCDDLWFTRNVLYDQAGYCFGSPLGQAVFDNAGCIGSSIVLAPGAKAFADHIAGLEAHYTCKVDTGRAALDLDDLAFRRNVARLPVRDEFESACLGWLAPQTPLMAGYDAGAAPLGAIQPGDTVKFGHLPVEGWSYVTVWTPGFAALKSAGWLQGGTAEPPCQDWAG